MCTTVFNIIAVISLWPVHLSMLTWGSLYRYCYGRLLLQAWLLPDLNTIPYNCVRENYLYLSGYRIGVWCSRSLFRIKPGPYISAMHLFICCFVTGFFFFFFRKVGARPKSAIEKLIRFNVQKMDFLPNKAFRHQ